MGHDILSEMSAALMLIVAASMVMARTFLIVERVLEVTDNQGLAIDGLLACNGRSISV
jgi:hypothetical protein